MVAHPDGELGAYLDSLDRLHRLAEEHEATAIWPGHGPVIGDALCALDYYIAHRHERLEQVEGVGADAAAPAEQGSAVQTDPHAHRPSPAS